MRKLDFRFADEDDCRDIEQYVNQLHAMEYEEGSPYQFRNISCKVTEDEVASDLDGMQIKWIVLETPVPEEKIVAAARFKFIHVNKTSYVDIICADESNEATLKTLLLKIEHIAFSHGLDKVIVGISQWRTDLETVLLSVDYEEQSGHIWPENKSSDLIKPTMILEYHKNLNSNQAAKIVRAPLEIAASSSSAYADGSLLSKMEAVSNEDASFGDSKPGMYYNEDGVLCLDFDEDDAADSGTSGGLAAASQGEKGREENMESLIDSLFSALHKSLGDNTL